MKSRRIAAELHEKMTRLQNEPNNTDLQNRCNSLKLELGETQARELMDSMQRPRVIWLTEGDQRSAFLVRNTKARQTKDSIMRLIDVNGNQTASLVEMKNT